MKIVYDVGDRVELDTEAAHESSHIAGMAGTVLEIIPFDNSDGVVYKVLLDAPIENPSNFFFRHLSEDRRESTFAAMWLRRATEQVPEIQFDKNAIMELI